MNRILIIGLDGASPHLIKRWQDDLPSLRRLIAEGTSGTLWSVIPPRSVPAWYCFATGMNRAKIGIFGFSQRRPGTCDYTFANLTFCRAPTFWQWLNQYGVCTAVIHMPGTFPPHPVDGAMVSGWPAPLNRGNLIYTYPPELSREVDRFLGQPFEFISPKGIERANEAEMLPERLRIVQCTATWPSTSCAPAPGRWRWSSWPRWTGPATSSGSIWTRRTLNTTPTGRERSATR